MFAPRLTSILLLAASLSVFAHPASTTRGFAVEEATIAQIHQAFRSGDLTCRRLVDTYLARIEAYDRRGPQLSAIASINPAATQDADRLDRLFADAGLTGPLHCVPVIVKDNIETAGWETTAGSLALKGFVPGRDATAVSRLKAAGAIILAKANMADLALSALATESLMYGRTRNPYALDRVPAGSSGGTAVAVAANFALVGLGSDTGNSVRGPAAHSSIVGVRPTMGRTSRSGLIPLDVRSDVIGPMARTVEDAARVLDVLTGYDATDPMTEAVRRLGQVPPTTSGLAEGLAGMRIGLLSQAYRGGPLKMDPEIATVFARALTDLSTLGAEIVESVPLTQIPPIADAEHCQGLKYDLNAYLKALGDRAPVHSLEEIIASGRYHPSIADELFAMQASRQDGPESQACADSTAYRAAVAASLTAAMNRHNLDALVYPTWSQPPQLAGRVDQQTAGQTIRFATASGFPAITVPMGFTHEVLPAGLSFLGHPWSEVRLMQMAHAYEQATRHRRPPVTAPPLPCNCPEIR